MSDDEKLHPAVEAHRTHPSDTADVLRRRAVKASKGEVLRRRRAPDDDECDVIVRRTLGGRTMTTDGDAVARVDHHGELIAKTLPQTEAGDR